MSVAQEPIIGREVRIVAGNHPHMGEVGVIEEFIASTGQYVIGVSETCTHGMQRAGALPGELQFTGSGPTVIKDERNTIATPQLNQTVENSQTDENFDSLKVKSNEEPKRGRGGRREGAGRPKGRLDDVTIERNKIQKSVIDRIYTNADNLLNAAMNKALGETYLMKKITERDSKGKILRTYHEVVTSPQEIIDYLDGELEGNTSLDDELDDVYHYITTKPADILAFKDLYDRAFGKPAQTINTDLTSKGERVGAITDTQATQLLALRAKRGNSAS